MMAVGENARQPRRIAVGSDHVGFPLKEAVKSFLGERGIEYLDLGTHTEERTDYPLFARKVARMVAAGEASSGILICGTGIGMSIAANKVPGIRAAACSEPYSASLARQHNNANILTFGARVVGEGLALMIVEAWLEAGYLAGRHARRIEMITQIEAESHAGWRE